MELISKTFRSANILIFRSNFATASKAGGKKAVANKNAKPDKQKFMKKQKQAASKEMAATRKSGGADRSVPFSRALFTVENKSPDMIESEEAIRRELISKSWSRWTMLNLHRETQFEANFIRSRIKAMEALQTVSPVLAENASEVLYESAPITIRPAAETNPEKLPFE